MRRVEKIADGIIEREGGYVDDPHDPGGPTKFGVTLKTLQWLDVDLDGDGVVTVDDVKQLTRDEARKIILSRYYRVPKIDLLPLPLQASVFDMQVNAGSHAVRIL